jgi:hypothetical protein
LRTLHRDWPEGTGKTLLDILRDDRPSELPSESDLLLATELAGDFAVINAELVDALLSILRSGDKPETVRGTAAISLGPVLEHADTQGFEDADDLPIAERTFRRIQESLRTLYMDADVPKEVRRILEASVRAPQDWHQDTVRAAYASDDEAWRLTAVFCMRFVRGFDEQILEALDSENPDIHYEAVLAAGNWEVGRLAPLAALVASAKTEKSLRLAAIDAVASIRPHDVPELLADLADSDDEDIADAVHEALAMAEGPSGEDENDERDDDDDPRR